MTLDAVLSVASALIAIASLVVAVRANARADEANRIAREANAHAEESNRIAKAAHGLSETSALASEGDRRADARANELLLLAAHDRAAKLRGVHNRRHAHRLGPQRSREERDREHARQVRDTLDAVIVVPRGEGDGDAVLRQLQSHLDRVRQVSLEPERWLIKLSFSEEEFEAALRSA